MPLVRPGIAWAAASAKKSGQAAPAQKRRLPVPRTEKSITEPHHAPELAITFCKMLAQDFVLAAMGFGR